MSKKIKPAEQIDERLDSDPSLEEEVLTCLRRAYEQNVRLTPDRQFTRDRYRELALELNLAYRSYKIEQLFGSWSQAVATAVSAVVKEDELTELSPHDEDGIPYITKRKVKGIYKILVLPDIHVPYHCESAIEAAIQLGEIFQPDEVIQLGDLLDCYTLSTYSRSSYRQGNISLEINQAKDLLDKIKKRTGAKRATLLEGNHEARIRKYVLSKAPELASLKQLRVDHMLELGDIGWSFIPEHKFYQINDVFFTHGEYANMHSAKKHIDEYRVTVVHGHTHRITSRYHRGLDKTIAGVELGFLGSFEVGAEFVKRANWQHGVGTVVIDENDHWINAHHIQNGKVEYNGQIILS
jgi:predicted phosphodiesterase